MSCEKYLHTICFTIYTITILWFAASCSEPSEKSIPVRNVNQSTEFCDKDEIQHPNLLTVQRAYELLDKPDFLFIEVSKKAEYDKGHIPKALHVWRPDFRSKQDTPVTGMRCSPEEFLAFLQKLGIDESSTLILYDAKGGSDALRLAWVFDYYGFEKYKVINGGKKAWTLAGFPLSTEQTNCTRNNKYLFETKENQNTLARHREVIVAMRDTNTLIIDTREQYEFDGQCFVHQGKVLSHKKGAFDRGRIPSSIHLNWSTLSDLAGDHRIKCPKDLRYDLAQRGITKDKNIIVYCQSGSRSSHTAFVLKEILKFPNVKNYDGSWIEWSYLAQQGEKPIKKNTSLEVFEKEKEKLMATLAKK